MPKLRTMKPCLQRYAQLCIVHIVMLSQRHWSELISWLTNDKLFDYAWFYVWFYPRHAANICKQFNLKWTMASNCCNCKQAESRGTHGNPLQCSFQCSSSKWQRMLGDMFPVNSTKERCWRLGLWEYHNCITCLLVHMHLIRIYEYVLCTYCIYLLYKFILYICLLLSVYVNCIEKHFSC